MDETLAQERAEPETNDEVTSLVNDGISDVEDEFAADAVTERDEFASPEEAVLSVRDSVPGTTDHDDQHGVEQDRSDESER